MHMRANMLIDIGYSALGMHTLTHMHRAYEESESTNCIQSRVIHFCAISKPKMIGMMIIFGIYFLSRRVFSFFVSKKLLKKLMAHYYLHATSHRATTYDEYETKKKKLVQRENTLRGASDFPLQLRLEHCISCCRSHFPWNFFFAFILSLSHSPPMS